MSQQGDLLSNDPNEAACRIACASEEDLPEGTWPRQIADMVDVVTAHFRRRGHSLEEALTEAREVVLAQAFYMGGTQLYFPSGKALALALLHARIYHEHRSGASCEWLASTYKLSVRHIERIVANQAKVRYHRRQHSLFPADDANTSTT
jgi:Mor family transcriptional regulator